MIYTIKQLIKHGVHLGHYKWECDYRLSYFLLGIRNSVHIINLYYTLFVLKQVLYIVYNTCLLGHRMLIVNNIGYKVNLNFEKINKQQLCYINNKWKGGILTNQKEIFFNNEKLFLEFYDIGYNSLLPSYVFTSNIKSTNSCIFESITLNIPCSALIDSNIGFYGIFYGIPSNDDNFVSIYLYIRLFIKMYLKSALDSKNVLKLDSLKKNYENIKLKFIYENLLDIKDKYRSKYFIKKKKKIWKKKIKKNENEEKKIKIKLQDTIILKWKLRRKEKKELKKKKIYWYDDYIINNLKIRIK